jgi:RND family efflux transporter MFP subunit
MRTTSPHKPGHRQPAHSFICFFLTVFFFSFHPAAWAESIETFLEPNQLVEMASSYRDRLTVIHVKEGEQVKTGQLLAEFDNRVLQARLELARTAAEFHGRIDSATALVALQKSKLKVLKKLQQSGNARPQELDTVRTNLAVAESQLLEASESRKLKKAELRVIQAQVEEKKLKSPLDGVVIEIYKQEAELVGGVEQKPILILAQLNPLLAIFHLSKTAVGEMHVGDTVQLSVAGKQVTAEIDFISPIIEPQSGTMKIRCHLPNSDGSLISGSRCTLNLDSNLN